MTSTNHVMTGAVIALAVKQPALAIPMAFASHFVLDMIPHFGMYENNVIKRNASRWFRLVLSIDIPLMLASVIIVPGLAPDNVSYLTVLLSMIAAILPDLVWVPRFFKELKTKKVPPLGKFAYWHQKIQWYEHPPGLMVEAGWLAGVSYLVSRLT